MVRASNRERCEYVHGRDGVAQSDDDDSNDDDDDDEDNCAETEEHVLIGAS